MTVENSFKRIYIYHSRHSQKRNCMSRIMSILNSNSLDSSITGFQTFSLSQLNLTHDLEFQLPTNVRLGHLAEKVVSECIKSSANFNVLYENIQILEDKKTIGEIDFIIENQITKQRVHLELAYKFYLFDPNISSEHIRNWIGPNRNDSLKNKLEKLKEKQFPLLFNASAKSAFKTLEINEVSQALCLLASLFIPYESKHSFSPSYKKAIQGYYLDFETFIILDDQSKTYCIPSKKEWGMNPSENTNWTDFAGVEKQIRKSIREKQSLLYWQKNNDLYLECFSVWW